MKLEGFMMPLETGGKHRVEYPQEVVDARPPALRKAFQASPVRIK